MQSIEELLNTYDPSIVSHINVESNTIEWTTYTQYNCTYVTIIRYYDNIRIEDKYVRRDNYPYARFYRIF